MVEPDGIARAWPRFMADQPRLLSPVSTQLHIEQGFDSVKPVGARATKELTCPVMPANLMGPPAACVPAGRDAKTGLPIGVIPTGRRLREDLCLQAAEAIETSPGIATPFDPAGSFDEAHESLDPEAAASRPMH